MVIIYLVSPEPKTKSQVQKYKKTGDSSDMKKHFPVEVNFECNSRSGKFNLLTIFLSYQNVQIAYFSTITLLKA